MPIKQLNSLDSDIRFVLIVSSAKMRRFMIIIKYRNNDSHKTRNLWHPQSSHCGSRSNKTIRLYYATILLDKTEYGNIRRTQESTHV